MINPRHFDGELMWQNPRSDQLVPSDVGGLIGFIEIRSRQTPVDGKDEQGQTGGPEPSELKSPPQGRQNG
jgi:hypothetical protein